MVLLNLNPCLRDIEKELKILEQALDKSVIVSMTDKDGVITDVNRLFMEISGYDRNEIIGKTHAIVRHPDMEEKFFESMWHTITSRKIWQGEIKNRNKSGRSYWVKTLIMPIISDDAIEGYISIRTDITELVKLREAQRNFYNRVIHELHNKLSSIKLSVEWLTSLDREKEKGNCLFDDCSEIIKASQSIESAYAHLERLVNDMRDISRIDLNSLKLQMDWVDAKVILEDAHHYVKGLKNTNGNRFSVKNGTKNTELYLDDLRINQVLVNLLGNANKFTKEGKISLKTYIKDGCFVFEVKDNGRGIGEKEQEHIFDEYWKDVNSHGFGLGLPISKGFCELMGGNIRFESKKDIGSVFYLSFCNFRSMDG